jgi:endonuclease/exonuclease/phosphatase family metal-dependent hydrolase
MNSLYRNHFLIFVILAAASLSSVHAEIIRVMAGNLTSGSNQAYEAPGIRIFQGLDPDVLMIQEFNYLSGSLRNFVDTAFGTEFYYVVEAAGAQIPNGIISRYPIIDSGQWVDDWIDNRSFVWAVIDIPGNKYLQAVSVHLHSGSEETTRNNEAQALKTYVEENFDLSQYIVIGGDLNVAVRTENAISTFSEFLDANDHIPVDQNGNSNTSEPRTKPYDWVMPNHLLDEIMTTLQVGNSVYPEGLVFDSNVYTPLSEVTPVQYADSHVSGMQHMGVMKAFDTSVSATRTPTPTSESSSIPTQTPTRTPSPTPVVTQTPAFSPTPTRTPTITPTWMPGTTPTPTETPVSPTATPTLVFSATPATPSNSPTPTPSSGCSSLGSKLDMPSHEYHPGDLCYCKVTLCNPFSNPYSETPIFVILEIYGSYFFAPSFADFDRYVQDIPPGITMIEILPSFQWPSGAGTASGIRFYAGMTNQAMTALRGDFDIFEFGWSE